MNKYSSFLFTTCRWERLTLILPLIVSLKTTRSFKTVEQGWNLWHCQPVKEWLEWPKLMREKQVNSVSYVVIFDDDDDDDLLLVLLCAFWENSYKNGFLMLVCVCVWFFFRWTQTNCPPFHMSKEQISCDKFGFSNVAELSNHHTWSDVLFKVNFYILFCC